ncbi:PQQ-binding-like beta-propeller repeat protein [Streptomyces sp. NPDC002992]|uniref:protein kinase domain-containing protein n=1 Tax=Streptomyces sp. NPDC002992 TaxID=3154273 RepID=UPI0033B55D16
MLSPLTHTDPAAIATYRLLARLGSGGMGTVYLARTPGGRTVALKTMHARLAAEAGFRTRFRLETDAARIIGARHGAAVVDADPLAETPWLATEYVLGPPLDDAVALCGRLPEATVRALGAALAGGLAQLHSSDVVHRDLKPSNVLVTAYGPKIIDFGIARAAGDDHLTRTGAAAGTPAFMSPEQAGGLEHTPAGDVFALAGVLVFAATGHGPFGTGAPADLLYRVRYAEPDLTDVPEPLLPLLTACLSKDPSARPTTTDLTTHLHDGRGEFADHLPPHLLTDIARRATEVWHHHPHRLPAPADDPYATTAESPRTSALSRRKLLAAGGSLVGAGALGAGMWTWLSSRDVEPTGVVADAPTPSSSSVKPAAPTGGGPKPLWQTEADDRMETMTPLLAGDVVAFVENMNLRVRDLRDGRELWSDPLVMDSQGITTDGQRFFRFLDTGTGPDRSTLAIRTLTPHSGQEAERRIEVAGFDGSWSGTRLLTVANGLLFASSRLGDRDDSEEKKKSGWHLLAVNLRTGREAWRHAFDEDGWRGFVTHIVGSRLILGTDGEEPYSLRLEARDTLTGRQLWRRTLALPPTERGLRPGELAVDDRHIYVGGDRLRALRISDGAIAWEYATDARQYGLPAAGGGLVYATEGERGLVAISADKGARRWEELPPSRNLSPSLTVKPVIGRKYVYAPVRGGLSAIDLATRRSAWVYSTDASRYVTDRSGTRMIGAGPTTCVAFALA